MQASLIKKFIHDQEIKYIITSKVFYDIPHPNKFVEDIINILKDMHDDNKLMNVYWDNQTLKQNYNSILSKFY